MNYEERDAYGMYRIDTVVSSGAEVRHGPGPDQMGADTLLGLSLIHI